MTFRLTPIRVQMQTTLVTTHFSWWAKARRFGSAWTRIYCSLEISIGVECEMKNSFSAPCRSTYECTCTLYVACYSQHNVPYGWMNDEPLANAIDISSQENDLLRWRITLAGTLCRSKVKWNEKMFCPLELDRLEARVMPASVSDINILRMNS